MNDLQKTEFEILKHAIQLCDDLNLTYYLVCGSALGAVKYQGFIPWDDDVDIALPRKDYEIFCQKAQALLPSYLFLQNWKTQKRFPMMFSKLRDSRTTYIEKSAAHLPIHHGVYIDIFPLDGYPDNPAKQEYVERAKWWFTLLIHACFDLERSKKGKLFVTVERALRIHRHTDWINRWFEHVVTQYPPDKSNVWCNHGNWQGKLEYAPAWHYGKGTWAVFEGLRVRIPENYDSYLTQKYGNWRDELPPEQQIGHHYYLVCDCKRPYTYYKALHTDKMRRTKNSTKN